MQSDPDFIDFSEISPELSRPFRGLRVWLPLKMHGLAPFRRNLQEKLDLAVRAADELRRIGGIQVVAEPQLSLVAFRFAKPGLPLEHLNVMNRSLLQGINARGRVHLSGAEVKGEFLLRICVLSFRTHEDRIGMALEDVRAAVRELEGSRDGRRIVALGGPQ